MDELKVTASIVVGKNTYRKETVKNLRKIYALNCSREKRFLARNGLKDEPAQIRLTRLPLAIPDPHPFAAALNSPSGDSPPCGERAQL